MSHDPSPREVALDALFREIERGGTLGSLGKRSGMTPVQITDAYHALGIKPREVINALRESKRLAATKHVLNADHVVTEAEIMRDFPGILSNDARELGRKSVALHRPRPHSASVKHSVEHLRSIHALHCKPDEVLLIEKYNALRDESKTFPGELLSRKFGWKFLLRQANLPAPGEPRLAEYLEGSSLEERLEELREAIVDWHEMTGKTTYRDYKEWWEPRHWLYPEPEMFLVVTGTSWRAFTSPIIRAMSKSKKA